jgi:hypothetical protein
LSILLLTHDKGKFTESLPSAIYEELPAPLSLSTATKLVPHSNRSSEPSPTPLTELASGKRAIIGGNGSEAEAASSKAVVEEQYRVLERGDVDDVRGLQNPDVDWWFHGPRA